MKKAFYSLLALAVSGAIGTANAADKTVYVSIGSDVVKTITTKHKQTIDFGMVSSIKSTSKDFTTLSIPDSQIPLLSKLIHQDYKRCPGFFRHETLAQAKAFSEKSALANRNQKALDYTINNEETVYALLASVTGSKLESTVEKLSSYHNRFYTQQTGVAASNWIKSEWETIAAGRDDITVELFNHDGWAQPSVIATIKGTESPEEYVIAGGHLDSISGGSSQAFAPGADDNASGIAVLTSSLNTLVASQYKPAKTVVFMGYAAEEVGLLGSREIAQQYKADGKNVIGVSQFDMTGYQGSSTVDINFISDYTNLAQNQFMAQLLDTYQPEMIYDFSNCGYACSDHASWHIEGYVASFPFEAPMGQHNRQIHTSGDTNFDADHAMKFLKLSVIYLAELAKGTAVASGDGDGDGNGDGDNSGGDGGQTLVYGNLAFSETELSVDEGQSVTINVNRVDGQDAAISIDFATVDGTATAGTDFTANSGTLNWADQDTESKSITIETSDVSEDKTFTVSLTNPQGGAALGDTSTITVTILDKTVVTPDPTPTPTPPAQTSGGGGTLSAFWVGLLMFTGLGRRRFNRK